MRMSRGIRTKDIALIGVMVATPEAVKLALTFLPGVELVTLLIVDLLRLYLAGGFFTRLRHLS